MNKSKLIETYQSVEKREILDCRIKSLKEWHRHYGCNLSSLEILLICRTLTFMYDRITIPDILNVSLPYAVVSHNKIEETYFSNMGINVKKEKVTGDLKGLQVLKQLIDEEIPVLFKIDSRFLKQTKAEKQIDERLNLYYLSTLLLVGYDESEKDVFIILTNNDKIDTYNKISMDDFQKYRKTFCRPFSPEEICYYMEEKKSVTINEELIYTKTFEGLKETVSEMVSDDKIHHMDLGGFKGQGTTKGIFAMEQLKYDMELMIDSYRMQKNPTMIKLSAIFLRNNLMFGSYTGFRKEFSQSLTFLAQKYGIQKLYESGRAFGEIANEWKKMYIQLSKITHEKENLETEYITLLSVLNHIIEQERQQFSKLMELL